MLSEFLLQRLHVSIFSPPARPSHKSASFRNSYTRHRVTVSVGTPFKNVTVVGRRQVFVRLKQIYYSPSYHSQFPSMPTCSSSLFPFGRLRELEDSKAKTSSTWKWILKCSVIFAPEQTGQQQITSKQIPVNQSLGRARKANHKATRQQTAQQ